MAAIDHSTLSSKAEAKNFILKTGPAHLFDMEEILDETSLDIRLIRDEAVESEARPGTEVRVIELTFTSQPDWHGFKWDHYTKIYVPPGGSNHGNVGIIGVKWQDFEPGCKNSVIPETGKGTIAEYAEGTAIDLDIPIMVFAVPGEDINGMNESDFTGWAQSRMLQTGDFTFYSYYPLAVAYLRAMTLARNVLQIEKIRTVLLGCSKRGAAISIAAGVDPERIAGVMTTCFHGGNHLYMAALKFAQFGRSIGGPAENRTGPGYIPAPELLRSLNNPVGLTALAYFDPYLWLDQIKPSYFVVLGTNDEFFGLGSPNEMMTSFNGDKAFLAVDNTDHTYVSPKHLLAWRMWLEYNFHHRPIPTIEVTTDQTSREFLVSAEVASLLPIKGVKLFYSYNQGHDWRFATWTSKPMKEEGHVYSTALELKDNQNLGYYVQIRDSRDGLVSSLIETV